MVLQTAIERETYGFPEIVYREPISVNIAEMAHLLYPDGSLTQPGEMAQVMETVFGLIGEAETALQLSGDAAILMANQKISKSTLAKANLYRKGFPQLRHLTDNHPSSLLWEMIEGPKMTFLTQRAEDIDKIRTHFLNQLDAAVLRQQRDEFGKDNELRAYEHQDRAVTSSNFNRREYFLSNHPLTFYEPRFIYNADEESLSVSNALLTVLWGQKPEGTSFFSVSIDAPAYFYDEGRCHDQKPKKDGRSYSDNVKLLEIEMVSSWPAVPKKKENRPTDRYLPQAKPARRDIGPSLVSWDTDGTARFINSEGELRFQLDPYQQEVLRNPLIILPVDVDRLRDKPIDLVLTGLDIVQKAVLGENGLLKTESGRRTVEKAFQNWKDKGYCAPAIDENVLTQLRDIIDQMTEKKDANGRNRVQQELYWLAKNGYNVRPVIEAISRKLAKLIDQNPGRAMRYLTALALEKLFPEFEKALAQVLPEDLEKSLHAYDDVDLTIWNLDHLDYGSLPIAHFLWRREQLYDHALSFLSNQKKKEQFERKNPKLKGLLDRFKIGHERLYTAITDHPPVYENWRPDALIFLDKIIQILPERYPNVRPPDPEPLGCTAEDIEIMREIIAVSKRAKRGEMPVVACVVGPEPRNRWGKRIKIIKQNDIQNQDDPDGHAERLALIAAYEANGRQPLSGFTLYSSFEPCIPCATHTDSHELKIRFAIPSEIGAYTSQFAVFTSPKYIRHVREEGENQEKPRVIGGVCMREALEIYEVEPYKSQNPAIMAGAENWWKENVLKPFLEEYETYDGYIWTRKSKRRGIYY